MSQKMRILIVVGVLALVGVVLAAYGILAQRSTTSAPATTPQPGMIHVYVDGVFTANVSPADMKPLPAAAFKDTEEGKDQEGWWLRDVIKLYVKESKLTPAAQITLTGLRQGAEKKSATVTWAQALDPANNLAFDLAGDGQSVKLVSTMPGLNTRDQWIQGVAQIDVKVKP